VNICPYVTFGDRLVQVEGKPVFQVYEIPAGQSGKAPMSINLTSIYLKEHGLQQVGQCIYTFSIAMTIGDESHPVSVQLIVFPGSESIGLAISWLEGQTLLIPGKYPIYVANWQIFMSMVLASILMLVAIYKALKPKRRFRFSSPLY
jgi:hypothetical protein